MSSFCYFCPSNQIYFAMKKVLPLLLLVLALCQCTPKNPKVKYVTPLSEHPEQFTEEYITKSALRLFDYVPDHQFDPSIKPAFSEEYYNLLKEAWSIAENSDDFEDSEWLYYFVSGNDDPSFANPTKTVLETMVMDDWNTYAKIEYLGVEHDMVMHYENGDWVIFNFDGTLDDLRRYVKRHRAQ